MNLTNAVKDAGVVGTGGAGFPTHVKLSATVACFIVNAVECEPGADIRKIPSDRLAERLGLEKYAGKHAHNCLELQPDNVYLPFRQHIGKPAIPVKGIGYRVEKGELIAGADEGLSANIHASVTGIVTDITPEGMMIRRRKE